MLNVGTRCMLPEELYRHLAKNVKAEVERRVLENRVARSLGKFFGALGA